MQSIPTGTVTFMFSDVVGSTRLWGKDPDAMSASLRLHDALFTATIARFGGHVFATGGDSFAAAFNAASAGIECAGALQDELASIDWGAGPALSVRIGLHAGEAEERGGNYFGRSVNLAARVMSVAHGGQCVFTDYVRDSAAIRSTDLGVHALRDIEAPVHLNQLGDREFAPLWSLGAGMVSLPLPRTSLVGREESVGHVRKLVAMHRLVTITGVGGCGKTRLAIEVAYREVPSHPEGVWFADLSAITDAVALPGAVACALDLGIVAGVDSLDQIATYLGSRDALLVVDNCEHQADVVAEWLDVLLARCARLTVLATSREMLGIDGELPWKIPSLTSGSDEAAVQLFIDRAASVGVTIPEDAETVALIADIAQRLDGIPLAIELAAGRTQTLELTEIRDLLDDRFRLLSGGTRRSRQRQATLEGAVQWSYDLLSDTEQAMLQLLSVFQGGFAIADAASVAGMDRLATVDVVESLVAKSLVDVTRDGAGHLRHRLLETIRLFALARLVDACDADATRDRHMEHFYRDEGCATFDKWMSLTTVTRLGREYENFRSAATWALERGRPDVTARIAVFLVEPAGARGETPLVIRYLQLPAEMSIEDRILVNTQLSFVSVIVGDTATAQSASAVALELAERHPGEWATYAFANQGARLAFFGQLEESGLILRDALRSAEQLNTGPRIQALVADFLTIYLLQAWRWQETIDVVDHALEIAPDYGFRHVIEVNRATALVALGRIDEAQRAMLTHADIPEASQWAQMNLVCAHAVMGHTHTPEVAAKSLASVTAEFVARRPQHTSDFLIGFAYLRYLTGDTARVREIIDHTYSAGLTGLWSYLALAPLGATTDNAIETYDNYARENPLEQRLARTGAHSHRLLTKELEFWTEESHQVDYPTNRNERP